MDSCPDSCADLLEASSIINWRLTCASSASTPAHSADCFQQRSSWPDRATFFSWLFMNPMVVKILAIVEFLAVDGVIKYLCFKLESGNEYPRFPCFFKYRRVEVPSPEWSLGYRFH
jgi:hypothetical protein